MRRPGDTRQLRDPVDDERRRCGRRPARQGRDPASRASAGSLASAAMTSSEISRRSASSASIVSPMSARAAARASSSDSRNQVLVHPRALQQRVARLERGQLHRNAGAIVQRCAWLSLQGLDRLRVGVEVAARIRIRARALAQHVVRAQRQRGIRSRPCASAASIVSPEMNTSPMARMRLAQRGARQRAQPRAASERSQTIACPRAGVRTSGSRCPAEPSSANAERMSSGPPVPCSRRRICSSRSATS